MTPWNSVHGHSADGFQLARGWVAVAMMALSPCVAVGEIGPALTGLTGRANDAMSVCFSPAGITRKQSSLTLLIPIDSRPSQGDSSDYEKR